MELRISQGRKDEKGQGKENLGNKPILLFYKTIREKSPVPLITAVLQIILATCL